jgi:hypothetical protein
MSEYVSAQYLAERTGFTDRYFRDLAASGKLPGAYQPSGHGGAWRFNLKQFNRWWESRKVVPWQASTSAAMSSGVSCKDTGKLTDEAFEQRLDRLQKSVLGNGSMR